MANRDVCLEVVLEFLSINMDYLLSNIIRRDASLMDVKIKNVWAWR